MMKKSLCLGCLFLLQLNSALGVADTVEDELKLVKEKLKALEANAKKSSRAVQRTDKTLAAIKDRLTINGFMSAGAVKGEDDVQAGLEGTGTALTEEIDFTTDSFIALQFDYKLDDDLHVITQLAAAGPSRFETKAEWAFLKYRINDSFYIRAGRFRLPFYAYSETLEVGIAYPWARPPLEVYSKEVTSYEGVDFLYRVYTGDLGHSFQLGYGTLRQDLFSVDGAILFNWVVDYQNWSFRVSHNKADTKASSPIGIIEIKDLSYSAISMFYDNGKLLSSFETNVLDMNSGPINTFVAGYLMVGYRIDKFTPHITYSHKYTTEKNPDPLMPVAAVAPREVGGFGLTSAELNYQGLALGVRYDIKSNMAIKFDINYYSKFQKDANGVLTGNFGNFVPTSENDSLTVYTVMVDLSF